MPISLDPNGYGEFALTIDKAKSDAERPVFYAKCLTCSETLKFERLLKEARAIQDDQQAKQNDLLNQALAIQLVGWRKIDPAFSKDPVELGQILDDLLTPSEKWELVYGCQLSSGLTEIDRKKSASEQATATAGSAPLVP